MPGVLFRDAQPDTTASPNRADIVCFIGFVGRRTSSPLPSRLVAWLQDNGWRPRGVDVADDDPLLHVPVPIDSFEAFDRLFTWENRPPQPHAFPFTTWMGSAVRSFFRQGGARCFVVRAGDPAAYVVPDAHLSAADQAALAAAKLAQLGALLPGLAGTGTRPAERGAPKTWLGLGVLFGLDEPAFVCLPDLPELVADTALEPAGLPPLPPAPEVFVECAPTLRPPEDEVRQISSTPACTEAGYLGWRRAVHHAALFLRTNRRDVQLVAALPRPSPEIATRYTKNLDDDAQVLGLGRGQGLDEPAGIASAFVQLCYPWLVTPGAEALPGGFEPPDGVFAGVLARAIPEFGAPHSIGRQLLRGVHGFSPALPGDDLVLDTPKDASPALIHRVSLLGRTPDAPRVLSDVTTAPTETHRPACIGRLTAAILRTARHLGDNVAFDPSGEELWQKIRTQLDRLLHEFYAAGALNGLTAEEAYSVRCDETTTSQNDIDNGRVLAEVRFTPSHPVGLIVVVLSLRDGSVTALDVLT